MDGGELRKRARGDVEALIEGLEGGEIDGSDARKAVVDLLDALIPSGPLEGVERALLTAAVNGVARLAQGVRGGRSPERLKRRALAAERLERRAAGEA